MQESQAGDNNYSQTPHITAGQPTQASGPTRGIKQSHRSDVCANKRSGDMLSNKHSNARRSHTSISPKNQGIRGHMRENAVNQTTNPCGIPLAAGQPIYYSPQVPPPRTETSQQGFLDVAWPQRKRR